MIAITKCKISMLSTLNKVLRKKEEKKKLRVESFRVLQHGLQSISYMCKVSCALLG